MHAYTFPYKERRVFRDLEGGFWGGREGGVAIYENRGFRFLNPGFRSLRHLIQTVSRPLQITIWPYVRKAVGLL